MGVLQNQRQGQRGRFSGSYLCFVEIQTFSSKWGWCTTLQNSTVNLTAEERESTTVGSS